MNNKNKAILGTLVCCIIIGSIACYVFYDEGITKGFNIRLDETCSRIKQEESLINIFESCGLDTNLIETLRGEEIVDCEARSEAILNEFYNFQKNCNAEIESLREVKK